MSLEKCSLCGSEFLTEADPYIVRPTKDGYKLVCFCQIKDFTQADLIELKIKELEAKLTETHLDISKSVLFEKELKAKLQVAVKALEETVKKDRENGFWNQSEASKALAAIKGEGV